MVFLNPLFLLCLPCYSRYLFIISFLLLRLHLNTALVLTVFLLVAYGGSCQTRLIMRLTVWVFLPWVALSVLQWAFIYTTSVLNVRRSFTNAIVLAIFLLRLAKSQMAVVTVWVGRGVSKKSATPEVGTIGRAKKVADTKSSLVFFLLGRNSLSSRFRFFSI